MIDSGMEVIIAKIACLGKSQLPTELGVHANAPWPGLQKRHLGMRLGDIAPHLLQLEDQYEVNVCGEGGEYETLTLDTPIFKQKVVM